MTPSLSLHAVVARTTMLLPSANATMEEVKEPEVVEHRCED